MIDGAFVTAVGTVLATTTLLLAAAGWAVCSVVVAFVVGFILQTGRGNRS